MATSEYDVIVIGAGPVGENVADRAVRGGLTAVVVEKELVGGECSYWACSPSKALLRPGSALRAAQHVGGAAEAARGRLDVAAVLDRRDSFTSNWQDEGQVEWLDSAGIDLVRGVGRISGDREVTVEGDAPRVLRARHAVVVATGTDALIPDVPGLREARPWTNREATAVADVPESIVIVGGGPVACEMATAFLDLGSEVTVVSRGRLLAGMEEFAGEMVAGRLRARGARVYTETQTTAVARDAGGVRVTTGDGTEIRAAEILAAMGRSPRTVGIGLEAAGLADGEWIEVDDTMRVPGSDWLYAVGDVNHRVLLTHQGKYQARAAGDVIVARATGGAVQDQRWGAHVASADHGYVPQVVFCDPEAASIGVTSAQARDAGLTCRVVDYKLGDVSGAALARDGYGGMARMVVDEDRGVVVGVTFVGPDVAELLHAATIAVVGQVPIERLWHAVPSFPTVSEIWLRLLEAYGRPGK